MRSVLITLHKYAGLILGLLLSITGISGSIIVFDHALDEMLNPELIAFDYAKGKAPLADVLESASGAIEFRDKPSRIYLSRENGSPHMVRFPASEGRTGPTEVTVNPVNAEVLAVRHWGEYSASFIYHIHYSFLAGSVGHYVVGILGFLFIFFCISGVIIWWPKKGTWRRALTIKRNAGAFRFNFDLHKVLGIYLLPAFIVLSFSGINMVWHEPVESFVSLFLPMDEYPSPQSSDGTNPISVDEAVSIGQTVFPDAILKRVYLPKNAQGVYSLALNQPQESWSNSAASNVWIDQYSGKILDTWDPMKAASGNTFITWQFPLHNGDAFGLLGRWFVFFCGWVPAILFGTGVYMWWKKRPK